MAEYHLGESIQRWSARAALLAAVALCAWVLAHWFWRGFTPDANPLAPATIPSGETLARAHLFGAEGASAPAVAMATPEPAGALRLLGVMAEARGGGLALFRRGDGSLKLARVGEDIAAGEKLARISANSVEIKGAGGERRLLLREAKAPSAAAPGKAVAAIDCPLKAEERRQAYLLRPELLAGIMQERAPREKLFRGEAGGLRVTGQDALLAAMGLAEGDLIERAEGASLTGGDALITAIIEPLSKNRVLHLAGQSGGKPHTWIYANAALCGAS